MENIEQYNKIVIKYGLGLGILTFIFFVSMAILLWYRYFRKKSKVNYKQGNEPMRLGLIIFCLVGSMILCSIVSYQSIYDISNQAYITFEGIFEVGYGKSSGGKTMFLMDEKHTSLTMDTSLSGGTYKGTVIYALKTQLVLDYQIEVQLK